MLIDVIYSWRFYTNLKSGLLVDFYFKRILHHLIFENIFIVYNKYVGESFLIENISFTSYLTIVQFKKVNFSLNNKNFVNNIGFIIINLLFLFLILIVINGWLSFNFKKFVKQTFN